jgi:hypothetical protein
MDEGDHRVFVENSNSFTPPLQLHVGDSIANGKITDIEGDKIGFVNSAGNKLWIPVGSNFTGSQISISADRIQGALSSGSTANLSMEEQLRLRRLRETQGAFAAPANPGVDAPGAEGAPMQDQQQFQQQQQQFEQPQQQQQVEQQPAPQASGAGGSLEEQMRARRAAAVGGGQ